MNIARAEQLKKLLAKKPRLKLAAAESLTGGNVQALITSVSGASDYFVGGITAYTLDEKVRQLGVTRRHAKAVNCVSQQVAVEMAIGACQLFDADLAVATTGYAEPSAKHRIKHPMAWWALVHVKRGGKVAAVSGTVELIGASRVEAQQKIAESVVGMLVAYLESLDAAK
ncbi:MAG: CinA family protein [Opitutae bacterium]|nr:CinA family protein [Opitutae bacterium]